MLDWNRINWAGFWLGLFGGSALFLAQCPWKTCVAPSTDEPLRQAVR